MMVTQTSPKLPRPFTWYSEKEMGKNTWTFLVYLPGFMYLWNVKLLKSNVCLRLSIKHTAENLQAAYMIKYAYGKRQTINRNVLRYCTLIYPVIPHWDELVSVFRRTSPFRRETRLTCDVARLTSHCTRTASESTSSNSSWQALQSVIMVCYI